MKTQIVRFGLMAGWLLGSGFSTLVGAAEVTFTDRKFDDADWTAEIINNATANLTAQQETTGGNPGAFRRFAQRFSDSVIEVLHASSAFTYDPGTQGAIDEVAISCDFDHLSEWSFLFGFGIKQDGNHLSNRPDPGS